MTESATPKGLKKIPQHHSLTKMTGHSKIRMFTCAMGQWLRKCHGFDVDYSYRWVETQDGSIYFALSGSRSVQTVFADYLVNNNGDYFTDATVTRYGRNTAAFNRAFATILKLKHGRGAYGERA
ncbi:hypothetical protein [Pseudomonas sp. UMAB-40]|uniref:hypothetical protein n=1 Tax=Pseudomonas sp. UMAB-40 TaxID=1365407 RepID=UPI001C57FD9A|nr:hypothetical protein [Pseudomonas sp. UMAB-40]